MDHRRRRPHAGRGGSRRGGSGAGGAGARAQRSATAPAVVMRDALLIAASRGWRRQTRRCLSAVRYTLERQFVQCVRAAVSRGARLQLPPRSRSGVAARVRRAGCSAGGGLTRGFCARAARVSRCRQFRPTGREGLLPPRAWAFSSAQPRLCRITRTEGPPCRQMRAVRHAAGCQERPARRRQH